MVDNTKDVVTEFDYKLDEIVCQVVANKDNSDERMAKIENHMLEERTNLRKKISRLAKVKPVRMSTRSLN
jgi:hypothetical protein